MAPLEVFVFGDQTVAFEPTLHRLLHVKDDVLLTDFFDRVGFQLRRHVSSLPAHQQAWFPLFTTLLDLFAEHERAYAAPALKFALLCATEIGQFIRHLVQTAQPYPTAASTYLVGACTGSFAAAAISTSQTLSELLPAAVETVLASLKLGIRSLVVRHDIEASVPGESKSWSALVDVQVTDAAEKIAAFNAEKLVSPVSQLYISSVSHASVSISGPPRLLAPFLSSAGWRHLLLPIELPYHAPHLFQSSDLGDVVGEFHDQSLQGYKQRMKIISISSGNILDSCDFKDLLREAALGALTEPMRWDSVVSSLTTDIRQYESTNCIIHQVSSMSGPFISSGLSRTLDVKVNTIDSIRKQTLPDTGFNTTGKFAQSNIAIIGYSGRYPDSASNEEFWDLILAGRDVHRTIPEDRFDWEAHYDPTGKRKNTSRVKYGCFIKEPGVFDAPFFNMSPRESENADPAQRLTITSAYEAIEMAGLVPNATPSTQQDRIGVFYGMTSDDWREVHSGQDVDTYYIPGGNRAFLPGRISYFFRFCGPSLCIDTACSSSLAAIETACTYLWRGECDTALAGGVNILTSPDSFSGLDRGHFLTQKGNCNAFDDEADGYCRSDGVGTVILKRLEDAIEDNDIIHGVIRGALTNHCGRTDSITRPFDGDQASLFNNVMRSTGVDPLDVTYVEMHGTGTQAGDAAEMKSVLSVFGPGQRKRKNPLHLGTVKANIGHAESASGVSSLVKVLMMMKHSTIPPHCGIKTRINHTYPTNMVDMNVHIPLQSVPWSREDMPREKRIAFLNNFSAAGGNTALLLEDAPPSRGPQPAQKDRHSCLPVTVTARSSKSLRMNIEGLIAYIKENPGVSLSSLSYTTTARRIHHGYRIIVSGSDMDSIRNDLQKTLPGIDSHRPIPTVAKLPKITMVFTGQGTAYQGVGKQLFDSVPSFKKDVLRFNNIVEQQGFPSFPTLVSDAADSAEDTPPIVTQLALVCIQMALYGLWKRLGVSPAATVGHSLGEYPALYAAGVLTAADVIYLVGTRARLLSEKAVSGAYGMLAVKRPIDKILPELTGTSCSVACLNQPSSNVISGPTEQLTQLKSQLADKGVDSIPLEIPYAFHSAQVDSILEDFRKAANGVRFNAPSVPYISPLLGKVIPVGDTESLNASYLVNACRQPVNFQAAVKAASAEGVVKESTLWLEIGSHPACSGMIKGILGCESLTLASLRKNTDAWLTLTAGLEILYTQGIDIDWHEYHKGPSDVPKPEMLLLPRYAWNLKNYWIHYRNNFCLSKGDLIQDAKVEGSSYVPRYLSPSVQKVLEEDHNSEVSTFLAESDIHDERLAAIFEGHVVNNALICPSSLYAEVALTITKYMMRKVNKDTEATGLDVSDMTAPNPLVSRQDADPQLYHVSASADWHNNIISFQIFSVNNQGQKTVVHANFVVRLAAKQAWLDEFKRNGYLVQSRIASLHASADGGTGKANKLKRPIVYQLFAAIVNYGDSFQGMQEVILDSENHEATARVSFQVDDNGFTFNPCWIDSLGHIAGFIMNGSDASPFKTGVFINTGWEHMRCAVDFVKGKEYQVHNRMQLQTGNTYVGDTYILEDQRVVAVYEGVRFQGVPRQVLDRLPHQRVSSQTPPPQEVTVQKKRKPRPSLKRIPNKATAGPSIGSRVMNIIAKEAGVDIADMGPHDDFVNHGIDSLLSLTICGKIRDELGLDVPSALFLDYSTPKELIAFFGPAGQEEEGSSDLDTPTESESSNYDSGYKTDSTDTEAEDSVIEAIRTTIANETGVPVSELTPTTAFAELGIDSLLSLTISGKLTESLKIDLSTGIFMENDNLEALSKSLGLSQAPKPKEKPKKQQSYAAAPVAPVQFQEPSQELESGPQATSNLLWGNPQTADKIVFFFPAGSGSSSSYTPLPKLESGTAAYGLNCPWMKTPWNMPSTLAQMVGKYVEEIRRHQPVGPYYLGGWSAGGICAYEAACQLAQAGQATKRLILIDSPNPVGLTNPPRRLADFFQSLGLYGSKNKRAPPIWVRPHFDAFIRMLDDYQVQAWDEGSMVAAPQTHLVYARDGVCNKPDMPRPEMGPDAPREMVWLVNNRTDFSADGWVSLVGQEKMLITVLSDVNHFSIIAPGPHMVDIAGFLQRALL